MAEGLEERALLSIGLDPTYGFGGVALPNVPQNTATTVNFELINSIANQSGKVVAAGTLRMGPPGLGTTTQTMVVVRFNTDGSVDTSFGTNGTQTIPITSGGVTFDGSANDIAVQSDGKIDVVGTATSTTTTAQDIVVARLNSNGTIDTTFGTSGFRLVPYTSSTATPLSATGNALNIGPDGKIVAVGFVDTGGTGGDDFAIARLNTDGSLDTSFNTTGTATVAFDLGGATGPNDDIANDVVVQPDSKIVVVGSADVPASGGITGLTHAAVARLNANGTLDTSFNTTGKLDYTYNLGGTSADTANAVALQGTQIVIAGTSTQRFATTPTGLNFQEITVTRLNSSGSFDTSFNGSGKFILTLNQGGIDFSSSSSALLVLPDNSLLVGGAASEKNSSTGGTGILVKLTNGGTLDPNFGTAGAALLPASVGGRMIMQSDGKVAYGTFNGVARTTAPTPAVVSTTIVSTGRGRRARASAIQITFNTGLNPDLATNSKIYVVRPARGRRIIAIRRRGGVSYDPTTQTLTLTLARRTPVGSGFRVMIAPGGILGADGQVLAINTILVPVTTA